MQRIAVIVMGLLIATVLIAQQRIQDTEDVQPNQVGPFMRAKLEHSQKVLEGLALEDYDLIAKHGQALSLLSLESSWNVLETVSYIQHSNDFRRATGALQQAAKEKNLDGATLAYVEVCMKCVNCHKYVRKARQQDEAVPTESPKPIEKR
jgi:hypothetical protein